MHTTHLDSRLFIFSPFYSKEKALLFMDCKAFSNRVGIPSTVSNLECGCCCSWHLYTAGHFTGYTLGGGICRISDARLQMGLWPVVLACTRLFHMHITSKDKISLPSKFAFISKKWTFSSSSLDRDFSWLVKDGDMEEYTSRPTKRDRN